MTKRSQHLIGCPWLLMLILVVLTGASTEALSQTAVSGDIGREVPSWMRGEERIMFNHRLEPGTELDRIYTVPRRKILVITDIVIQNRSGGDEPVEDHDFSRVVVGTFTPYSEEGFDSDVFFTAVGNDTVNLHFTTGMEVREQFRIFNASNSTAEFCEVTVTGYLARRPRNRRT